MNGDGILDIVVPNYVIDTISTVLNIGRGSFSAPVGYAAGKNPIAVALGDLNGDGKLDVAVANNSSDSNVRLLLNRGTGLLMPAVSYAGGLDPQSLVVGDFNNDGMADLVTACYGTGDVNVFLGRVGGTFGAPVTYLAGGPGAVFFSIATGDLNGDGQPDLAVGSLATPENVHLLFNNGSGSFVSGGHYQSGNGGLTHVAVGDVTGDGKLDIVVADDSGGSLHVLVNDGAGSFSDTGPNPTGSRPLSLAIGDLNGDGRPDLAAAIYDEGRISVHLNLGGASFAPPISMAVGTNPEGIQMGDLNGDGKLDIVVANSNGGTVSVLLNSSP